MASLEPPVPTSAAYVLETPQDRVDSFEERGILGWNKKYGSWTRWRRAVGLLLLFMTVFLWTVSNFLASVSDLCRKDKTCND